MENFGKFKRLGLLLLQSLLGLVILQSRRQWLTHLGETMRKTFGRKKRESPRILLLRDDSSMREATCKNFSCAARSLLSMHPLAVPSYSRYWTENSRLLALSLFFFRFLARKYSFLVSASLVNERLLD